MQFQKMQIIISTQGQEEHNTGMQRKAQNTLACTGGMYSSKAGFIQGGGT